MNRLLAAAALSVLAVPAAALAPSAQVSSAFDTPVLSLKPGEWIWDDRFSICCYPLNCTSR